MTLMTRIGNSVRGRWTSVVLVPLIVMGLVLGGQAQERGPLTLEEITTLLTSGVAMAPVENAVRERGLDFPLTPAIEADLRTAGATDAFLETLRTLPGRVTVTSEPPGAMVSIDGQVRGQTPLEVELSPGQVGITVALDGYREAEDTLTVSSGMAETAQFSLEMLRAVLTVVSQPPGATVQVDGQDRGLTPLTVDDLPPGDHRIGVSLAGHLENVQVVTLTAKDPQRHEVTLTQVVATQPVVESDSGGGSRLPLILGVVGGGIGAAVALAGGGGTATTPPTPPPPTPTPPPPTPTNEPPEGGQFSVTPAGFGLASATRFTFTADGVSDPDDDPITYLWQFGDGSPNPPSALQVSKIFTGNRSYTVRLFVTDGEHANREVASAVVMVRTLTGTWTGDYFSTSADGTTFTAPVVLRLTQAGSPVTGTFTSSFGPEGFSWCDGVVSGSQVRPPLRTFELRVQQTCNDGSPGTISIDLVADPFLNMLTLDTGARRMTVFRR